MIDRNEKYIIALCLLLNSGLNVVKGYLNNIEKGLHSTDNAGVVLELSKKEAVIITVRGNFLMIRSNYNMQIGRQITFKKSEILRFKGNILRYAALTAVVIVALIGVLGAYRFLQGLTGIDFNVLADKIGITSERWSPDSNKEDSPTDKPVEETDKNSLKNTASSKKIENKKAGTPVETKDKTLGKDKKSTPEPNNSVQTTESKSIILSQTSPTFDKVQQTVIPSHIKEPKPTNQPVPTGYPTLRATGVPGIPRLSADVYEVNVGDEYTINMIMDKGNNGTTWVLYENDKSVATRRYADNSPNEQIGMRLFNAKQPGSYTYRCELTNAHGTTSSEELIIVVK